MSKTRFRIGDKVSFRGTRHPDRPNDFVSVHEDGPDVFVARITENVMGLCWGLKWDDGTPLGLPFHNFQLTRVSHNMPSGRIS